jgi:DNA modification methylase
MQKDHSTNGNLDHLVLGYPHSSIGRSQIILADCLEWFAKVPENSFHGIVTDPPYGLTEYDADQLLKRENGPGGIWRLPPAFDGAKRAPLPRFTALNERERKRLSDFLRIGQDWLSKGFDLAGMFSSRQTPSCPNSCMAPWFQGGWSTGGKLSAW